MYLIDSSAWIDFLRKKEERLLPYLESREASLADIILFELLAGTPPERQSSLRESLSLFPRLPLTEAAVVSMAGIAFQMRKKGCPPQTTDALIAGIALDHEATVIHKDRDFETIKNFCPLKTISLL